MGWSGSGTVGTPGPPGPPGPPGGGSYDTYSCPATVSVRDAVYESAGVDTVDRANASSTATMPVIGFVIDKPTTTTCTVQFIGPIPGFSGLTTDAQYYMDTTNGGITTTPPSGIGSGKVIQKVGIAKSTTLLEVLVDQTVVEL